MGQYSQYLYVRAVNPGTNEQYYLFGSEPADVSAFLIGSDESASSIVARYTLAGTGEIHNSAPMYVEGKSDLHTGWGHA